MTLARITLEEITKVLLAAVVINAVFALVLYPWVTKEDLNELPDAPLDRFITLFTFGLATFTTSGFVTTNATSRRLKIISAIYVLLVVSGGLSYFFKF